MVFDLEGVLLDSGPRFRNTPTRNGAPDWGVYFSEAEVAKDLPKAAGVAMAREYAGRAEIIVLTGRPDRLRGLTHEQLDRAGVKPGLLIMRPEGEYRPDVVWKPERVRELLRRYSLLAAFDDRAEVLAAYAGLVRGVLVA